MGCVPSRCIVYHPRSHRRGGKTPFKRRKYRDPEYQMLGVTDGRHHFVALTSSTYGYYKAAAEDQTATYASPDTIQTEDGRTTLTITRCSSQEFSDTTTSLKSMINATPYEDCFMDKEVVLGVLECSSLQLQQSGGGIQEECFFSGGEGGSVSSSSCSCGNKLASLDTFYEQAEVINVNEVMEGLDSDECSRLLTPPVASLHNSPRKNTKSPFSSGRFSGMKRRILPRSSSLSAMSAARKLENAFAADGVSAPGLQRLLTVVYEYYVGAGRRLLQNVPPTPFDSYELRCPPGGESSVVLYCTSLRGIRKTFEDCHNVRMILRSFGVTVDERDVSMHAEFRTELKQLLKNDPVPIPKLFIRGRLIGGLIETKKAHEEGLLAKMLEGIPKEDPFNVCDGCGDLRFMPCLECFGSCKIVEEGNVVLRCPDCNENGLIRCPICC